MTSIEIVEQNVPNKEESTKLFSRTLIESMNKQVRLVDSDNGLDLFCYIKDFFFFNINFIFFN